MPLGEVRDNVLSQDLTQLTFDDDSFDLVISEDVLEHVQDLRRALSEVRRVLRVGGHFIFTIPYNDTHKTRIRARLDADGKVREIFPPVLSIGIPRRLIAIWAFFAVSD